MLYDFFRNFYDSPLEIGDKYITNDYTPFKIVSSTDGNFINNVDYKYKCVKIPFDLPTTSLTEDQISLIEDLYNKCKDKNLKKNYKDFITFIKIYKNYNRSLYNLYIKVQNVEFIPKTTKHLKILHSVIYS